MKIYYSQTSGRFFAKFKTDSGAWRTRAAPESMTREQAQTWADSLFADNTKKTFRTLSVQFVRARAQRSPQDALAAERLLRLWVLDHPISDVELDKLTVPDAVAWIEWVKQRESKRGRPPASTSLKNILKGLRGYLDEARGRGWTTLTSDPLRDPFVRRMKGPARNLSEEPIVLTREQALKLIHSTDELLWFFAIQTGMRAGEIRAITWEDIDLENGSIFVSKQEQAGRIFGPKSGSKRTLPISSSLLEELRRRKGKGNLFEPSLKWAEALRLALLRAGLSDRMNGHPITFHALRRTTCSLLHEACVPLELIAMYAGHKQHGVTAQAYIKMNFERLRDAVELLPKKKID